MMSRVRCKNTKIELLVRKAIWKRGKRYRIHDSTLPGIPDISVKRARLAVFLDGCFWHGCPLHSKLPKTNRSFWKNKILSNLERRTKVRQELNNQGYTVLEVFQCEITSDLESVVDKICSYL